MKRRPVVLFRLTDMESEREEEAIQRYLPVVRRRTQVQPGDFVIARYSAWPFYKELEDEIHDRGAELINTYAQHRYVADLQNYVADLGEMTPETWFRLEDVPEGGPYVVKGETNSRKDHWLTMMYAETKRDAVEVAIRLMADSLIGQQQIYVRRFVPLDTLLVSVGGQPITREFRFFVAFGQILSGAYYWSCHVDELEVVPSPDEVPREFLRRAIDRVKDHVPAFVLDVAKTRSGEWIVIELNDLQQSGLSENKPDVLYPALRDAVQHHLGS